MFFLFCIFLICLALWLGVKFFNRVEANKEAKQAGGVTYFKTLSQWGYGIALLWVVMLFVFFLTILGLDFLAELLIPIVFLVMPLVLYVFTGVVHFSTRGLYKSNQLDYHEEKIHKASGVAFYVVTVLIIWLVIFLIRVFTGEIMLM